MTREEARKVAEVMMAYADGKDIEFCQYGESWDVCKGDELNQLEFNFDIHEYRIKKEPTYRPFKDKDECWNEMLKHQPFGWIKHKKGEIMCLTCISNELGFIYFYENSTFVDGTPFGIKEK